jgi:hypothetical protein
VLIVAHTLDNETALTGRHSRSLRPWRETLDDIAPISQHMRVRADRLAQIGILPSLDPARRELSGYAHAALKYLS